MNITMLFKSSKTQENILVNVHASKESIEEVKELLGINFEFIDEDDDMEDVEDANE